MTILSRRKQPKKILSIGLIVCMGLFMVSFASAFDWVTGMDSYWGLEDNTGSTNVIASIGTNGTLSGGNTDAKSVVAKVSRGFDMDGTGDYVTVADGINIGADFSVNMWIKPDAIANQQNFFDMTTNPFQMILSDGAQTNGSIRVTLDSVVDIFSSKGLTAGNWYMITVVHDQGTNTKLYINSKVNGTDSSNTASGSTTQIKFGDYAGAKAFAGPMDEVGIWTRALSQADINELYDGGSGVGYLGLGAKTNVSLEKPINDSVISATTYNFTVSGNVSASAEYNATSVTFHVWNASTGLIFNSTNVSLAGTSPSYNQSLVINNFTLGDYKWNAEVCMNKTGETLCVMNQDNFTFTINPFSILDETWPNSSVEGSTDTFTINISLLSGFRVSTMKFVYNGTATNADFTEYATNKYFATITRQAPLVGANTNVTFYWNTSLENGVLKNSTLHNQTVYNTVIDDCSSGTFRLFNFSVLDEDNQTLLPQTSENVSVRVELIFSTLSGSALPINFTQLYTGTNPAVVCNSVDLNNSKFSVSGVIEYKSKDRFVEFYHIQNYTLTNSTDNQNISLYNLNSSLGQEFKITYKDENFNIVPGALIQIQRKYIQEGVFKTVEIPKIGSDGTTIAHLIKNNIIYNLIITKDGSVVATFTDIIASCQNPTIYTCEININSFSSTVESTSFSKTGSFSSTLTYNETSRKISSVFVIASGVPATVTLNATLFDSLGNQSICSDTLMAAGGTLSCTVPTAFGNSTVVVKIYVNNIEKKFGVLKLGQSASQLYGNNLIFIGISILLLLIGMGITDNPMVLGIMLVVGVVILGVLNVVNNFGWIGSGATILWLIASIVIILIKGGNRQ